MPTIHGGWVVSTSVTGKVVDIDNPNNGFSGLPVVVRDTSAIVASQLGTTSTGSDGSFTITIAADSFSGTELGPRQLEVSVRTAVVGRLLYLQTYPDSDSDTTTIDTISLKQADVTGWAVTLPGTSNVLPVREGTALQAFVDDKTAWSAVNSAMKNAKSAISMMQLALDMPRSYQANAADESPEVVLDFPDSFDGTTSANDLNTFPRPERTMVTATQGGHAVKVLISSTGNAFINFIVTVVHVWNHLFHGAPYPDAGEVQKYFTEAGTTAKALTFTTTGLSVVHAKTVLVDAVDASADVSNAYLLGSPFEQSYWDSGNHQVYEARRGSCSGEPDSGARRQHRDPRADGATTCRTSSVVHWSKADDGSNPAVALDQSAGGDHHGGTKASTWPAPNWSGPSTWTRCPACDNGEMGLLEAYLRAIENADRLHLLREPVLHRRDDRQGAGGGAQQARPDLQVILMVNVVPDMPFYPHWQTESVRAIRRDAAAAATRFGVFTAWSHDSRVGRPQAERQQGRQPAAHAELPAHQDGGRRRQLGDHRLGQPRRRLARRIPDHAAGHRRQPQRRTQLRGLRRHRRTCPQTGFVDTLPRGAVERAPGHPDHRPAAGNARDACQQPRLATLWNTQAAAKLAALINNPTTIDPNNANGRVLAFRTEAARRYVKLLPWQHPYRNFLQTAGGDPHHHRLVEQTTAFNFHDGKWADA